MKTLFYKMHGCGNDYIYFNCFNTVIENPQELALRLSDRHFGIGGDGIVLICRSDVADAKMRMFNADGSEGKMCGNAIRCVGKFLYDSGIRRKRELSIETLSGIKHLKLFGECEIEWVSVDMGKPEFSPKKIPVLLKGERILRRAVAVGGKEYEISCVSMGNPHCLIFVEDTDNIDIREIGPKFEKNPLFPEGVNTEFVQVLDRKTLKMRVWERGSGETLACGTGACASAVIATVCGFADKGDEITVKLTGGDLRIRYTDDGVTMTGGAQMVFEGAIDL
ncbi:MAG: diaminopimelate epimerase [Clostridiales bacterium]|nr:diaminopimelate epimerase [Clostridiales bacterium]